MPKKNTDDKKELTSKAPKISIKIRRIKPDGKTQEIESLTSDDGTAESLADGKKSFPVIAMRGTVIFPNMVLPLTIQREASIAALKESLKRDSLIMAVCQKNAETEVPSRNDLYLTGTLCRVLHTVDAPDGSIKSIMQGLCRVKVGRTITKEPHLEIIAKPVEEYIKSKEDAELTARIVSDQFKELAEMTRHFPPEMLMVAANITNPGNLADLIAFHLPTSTQDTQKILDAAEIGHRLQTLSAQLLHELGIAEIEMNLRQRAEDEIKKSHKEYYLRRQLKAIHEELGDDDDDEEEEEKLASDIKEAAMPEYAEKHALKELKKLKRIPPASPDHAVLRNYLDWMLQLPWSKSTEDCLDIIAAKESLDNDHYGLKEVKERILEFLAVRKIKPDHKGQILCFAGPPGVGKTSLGRSIAKTMGRKFNRTSLGGIHDEAEIRGHRRTYIGALPGRIIQAVCTAGSRNPVIMLDEIDKVGKDYRGDPSAALLEALDPEQNCEFKDHYISIPFDLSQVMFIMTANTLDTIPPALRDRMEVISIPGYTREEKLAIAKQFLVPRQITEHGLTDKQLTITDEALKRIISEYTRESGVRGLERTISKICRKRVKVMAEAETVPEELEPVDGKDIPELLGPAKYTPDKKPPVVPGLAQGLSWTQVGGEMLNIETAIVPGRGKMRLTGQLGKVMKESARTAVSWVRTYMEAQGIPFDFYSHDIHIHVPDGAVPKDGPSAGITLACSFFSAVTGQPVPQKYAMTGEITLTGMIMPVGGIKEKVLAAYNDNITNIILPTENIRNTEDIPEPIRNEINFIPADKAEDVFALVFKKKK